VHPEAKLLNTMHYHCGIPMFASMLKHDEQTLGAIKAPSTVRARTERDSLVEFRINTPEAIHRESEKGSCTQGVVPEGKVGLLPFGVVSFRSAAT
jgi:hypothetical protein